MRAARKSYLTDLTNEQWDLLKEFIPAAKPGGRPRTVEPREIINAIFYILSTGCPWRMLPHDFPVWQTVYECLVAVLRWRKPPAPAPLFSELENCENMGTDESSL
jgi:transposase